MTPADLQACRIELEATLAREREHALRHGPRESYLLDGQQVPYAVWEMITADRLNQLALACQKGTPHESAAPVEVAVPPGDWNY